MPQSDYEQNDETQKDYIKNRPFWSKKTTRLRNTIQDYYDAGGDFVDGIITMDFIVNGEFFLVLIVLPLPEGTSKFFISQQDPRHVI